jgi:hypothetical protein
MKIYDYMAARAKSEGKQHTLPKDHYKQWLNQGIRCIFGVWVDERGTPICDEQNPAFFEKWETLLRVEPTMKQQSVDWSDTAVDYASDYLKNDGGEIFGISAETRTLAKTIKILSRYVQSTAESAAPEKKRLLLLLLDKVEELNLIDACQFFLRTVANSQKVVNATPSPTSALAASETS